MQIIDMQIDHVEDALRLSEEAFWNQTAADWTMMLEAGDAICIECEQGRVIATALTLPYGPKFGWISMVLVSKPRRKKGLATQLLNACIQRLENNGRFPVLDATPAGEQVYRPLGFMPHLGLTRWQHDDVSELRPSLDKDFIFRKVDRALVHRIDAACFGGDRGAILDSLMIRSKIFSSMTEDGCNYLLGRDGRNATQIGPIYAEETGAAIAMLNSALEKLKGPVFVDANNEKAEFVRHLERLGFSRQRPFLRMVKDSGTTIGKPSRLFAMAGPELG